MIWLHRFAKLVVVATLALLTAGGLVTSTGSGLSVPDWPTTYGSSMFTFPVSRWVGGIFYEHGHRLIASTVGLLTLALAAWLWRRDSRFWVKALGFVALAAIVAQGIVGGLTVLLLLPAPVSVGHAGLAQVFFALTVALALATSPGWVRGYDGAAAVSAVRDGALRRLLIATPIIVYTQILLGATMRHTGAGLAIPDFPLAFGQLIPLSRLSDPGVAVHFTHRVVALVVAGFAFASAWWVWSRHRTARYLIRPALLAVLLVLVQIALGVSTVLTGRDIVVNTAHLAVGALTFATTVVLAMRAHRAAAAIPLVAPVPAAEGARG